MLLKKKKNKGDILTVCNLQNKTPSQARILRQEIQHKKQNWAGGVNRVEFNLYQKAHSISNFTEMTATQHGEQPTGKNSKTTRKVEII